MEFDSNNVYCIDIDNTICDSSSEYARWKEECSRIGCGCFSPDDHRFCSIGNKSVCIYGPRFRAAGIFSDDVLRSLPPILNVRRVLKRFRTAYYVSGRPESQRASTLDWLERMSFPLFRLYLRHNEDMRAGVIGKAEVIFAIKSVYGKDGETWVWIDDDDRAQPLADQLGVEFIKAPECFF